MSEEIELMMRQVKLGGMKISSFRGIRAVTGLVDFFTAILLL